MKPNLATSNTVFSVGQHVKLTTIVHGEAVYDRKGNLANSNWPGVKFEYAGIVSEVYQEGSNGATVVRCKRIKKPKNLESLDYFNFYPQNIGRNEIVELLPSPTIKMYIAVLDEFPDYMTPTLVAHSVLNAHLKFEKDRIYKTWLEESFKKCVIRVNQKEFDRIAALPNVHLGHENNTLGGKKSCAVVCPIDGELPNVLKYAKLWKPLEKQ